MTDQHDRIGLVRRRHAVSRINVDERARCRSFRQMLLGYARVSTTDQNPDHLISQRLREAESA